ncbi:MAG: GH92 family glycosyl hydrolase [Bacteroidales bacterium]|nr:GH92 family glycosyl hydrolase [Bacteroidales bacterium]
MMSSKYIISYLLPVSRIQPYLINLLTVVFLLNIHPLSAQDHNENYIQYVNPFIGTQKMGHTYPGATVPFGMVQLSPDTDTIPYEDNGEYNRKVYEYCAGYQYDDPTIVGFSHTHFSGTGHSDLGDILIMPSTGPLKINPGTETEPDKGYRSRYSHDREYAEPDYYRVDLLDYDIRAELTASNRVGFHRYTFPRKEEAHIILDMIHGIYNYEGKNVWTFIRVENDTLVTGYRQTSGWARTRTVYFAISFSKPFKSYGHTKKDDYVYKGFYRKFNEKENFPEMAGRQIRAYFNFDVEKDEKIKVKVALSPVSTEGAIDNMMAEVPHWDFDKVKRKGQQLWNSELSKIKVETVSPDEKTVFYTALYHTFLSPITYMDIDGMYTGIDQNIHLADGFTNYTIFSLWDTYRALHPLFNLIQTDRSSDIIESMLAHFDQSVHPMLPVWSHYANENWCMIGYHSVSVIADAIIKGVWSDDIEWALDACVKTASYGKYDGLDYYMKLGYVPEDKNNYSVSKTLEYAYDDWCIKQLAEKAGNDSIAGLFSRRAEYYRNVFNPVSGFMHPRLTNGKFRAEFDPLDTYGQGFIEGNAWNYGLYVPHDIPEMIKMMGGKKEFPVMLDSLFNSELGDEHIERNEDITREGIIGMYVHGNEPGHHIPYLYSWTDKPWKTQERVRMIMDTMYLNKANGLCGNDDCGQMSAWYIFSALGFYPVCPGSDQYSIGSPLLKEAEIQFENGNSLKIKAVNQGKENVYVDKLVLNGKKLNRLYITHSEIVSGGELVFHMKGREQGAGSRESSFAKASEYNAGGREQGAGGR